MICVPNDRSFIYVPNDRSLVYVPNERLPNERPMNDFLPLW